MKRRIPKQVKFLNLHEMQEVLDFCATSTVPLFRAKDENESFKAYSFIEDLRSNLKVSLKVGGKPCTYVFKLDTGEVIQKITGVDSFKILSRYAKIPRISNCDKCGSARPFLYINKNYDGTRNYAYGYDLNSAYSWAMKQPIPDTTKIIGKNCEVGFNQIGFIKCNPPTDLPVEMTFKDDLIMVEEGFADIVFEKKESPFIKFVDTWYQRKKKAKTKDDKTKAKGVLNYSIGYLQNINPYIRACILTRVNERISKLVDNNTLFCNTDSLVSMVRRPDIEENIGEEVGQWKLEHEGYFAYVGYNYQWDENIPVYRGVPKAWFPKGYDILSGEVPMPRNKYYLDHFHLKIKEIDYGKEA